LILQLLALVLSYVSDFS